MPHPGFPWPVPASDGFNISGLGACQSIEAFRTCLRCIAVEAVHFLDDGSSEWMPCADMSSDGNQRTSRMMDHDLHAPADAQYGQAFLLCPVQQVPFGFIAQRCGIKIIAARQDQAIDSPALAVLANTSFTQVGHE